MIITTMESHQIRTVILYTTCTCVYLLLCVFALVYTESVYKIGKYKCLALILAIILAEITKLILGLLLSNGRNTSRDTTYNKIRKYLARIKLKEIFKCLSLVTGSTLFLYTFIVLLGAPIFRDYEETFMFSALLTSLIVFPVCINVGSDTAILLLMGIKPLFNNIITEMFLKNIQITIICSWLGAVVLPLDWERPWQVWPIPCALGAICGCFLAHFMTFTKILPRAVKILTRKHMK